MTKVLSFILCNWRKFLKFCFHKVYSSYRFCGNCYIRSLCLILFCSLRRKNVTSRSRFDRVVTKFPSTVFETRCRELTGSTTCLACGWIWCSLTRSFRTLTTAVKRYWQINNIYQFLFRRTRKDARRIRRDINDPSTFDCIRMTLNSIILQCLETGWTFCLVNIKWKYHTMHDKIHDTLRYNLTYYVSK